MPLKSRPRCFSSCCLCAGTQSKWACAGALKDGGLVSHSPRALLEIGPAGFHRQVLRELVFPGQVSKAGEPHKGRGPLTPQGNLLVCGIPPLVVSMPGEWPLTGPLLCTSCPSWSGLAFVSSVVEHLFSYLQAIHPQRQCFICSCRFGVSMGGGELRAFQFTILIRNPERTLLKLFSNTCWVPTFCENPQEWMPHFKALSILERALHTKRMWS